MIIDITIDTREQTPWHFPPDWATVRRGTLKTGDYALTGDDGFALERKGLDDFIGTISTGWPRFCRELNRMVDWPAKVIIVEGRMIDVVFWEDSDGSIVAPEHRHYLCAPSFVLKRIAELTMRGVCVLLAETPELASAMAYKILIERHRSLEGIRGRDT